MKRRSSVASGNTSGRPPEEQLNEEETFDPLFYRLQHLNQRESSSGIDGNYVDPFNVDSSSDDQSNNDGKIGDVDDAGWESNNCGGDNDCYHQEGDELFLDFGGRTPDQARRQRESLSTPRFGGSQSTHSPWDSTVEHSRRSLSTISCTRDDVSDGLADIERQCEEMISKSIPISPHEISMPLEQMIPPRRSEGQTAGRAPSISTISTVSSPTDKLMRDNAPSEASHLSLSLPPLTYKPLSRRQSLSSLSNAEEVANSNTQTDNSNLVQVSVVPQGVEAQNEERGEEEECPRLEQLQQMTLEELKSELMTIQAQSKTNLENSWKAAERMRVENSELDEKAEGLKAKLDTAFEVGLPVSRRHSDSIQRDGFDTDEEMSDLEPVDRREGMMRRNLSVNNLAESRRSGLNSGFRSSVSLAEDMNLAWPDEEKDDSISVDDVIEAFTQDLESPGTVRKKSNMGHDESHRSSGGSSQFGFFCLDVSHQSEVKTPFEPGAGDNQTALDQSDGSSGFSAAKSGVYYPPPNNKDDDDEKLSNLFGDNAATIKVVDTDSFGGGKASKQGCKRRATLDGDQDSNEPSVSSIRSGFKRRPSMLVRRPSQDSNTPSASSNRSGFKRRSSMLVRRPSFMGLFGLNDSSRGGESEASSDHKQSTASSTEPLFQINGNVFQVEARSIMIEELENELKEKGDIVVNLIDDIEEQKEEIDNCEVEITRLRAKLEDERKELTCTQSALQQSVKELIQWDSAIESRLDQTEGQRQRLKQKEKDLMVKLASENPIVSDCKIELENQRSRCKEEYNAIQESSNACLSMVISSVTAMKCEKTFKQLFDSLDVQTDKLHQLFGNYDRVTSFKTLKRHIEDQRDKIINASDKLFRSEIDLRGNLIRLKLQLGGSDECSQSMESSLVRAFTNSLLAHIVEARQEHARFLLAVATKVDDFLLWWGYLLDVDSTLEGCEERCDAVQISSILERVLADVTEELDAIQTKIDEEYDLFKSNVLSTGILDQKLHVNKESHDEVSDCRAELDHLNEQVNSLEMSLSERLAVRKDYASTLDQLHSQDEADSKTNLQLLDNIQEQVNVLAKKLAMDDAKIASLRQSLREKKERVADLEYDKKRRDIMHS